MQARYTKLFEDLHEEDQINIAEMVKLADDEEIMLSFYPDNMYWWILTNFRIIINDNIRLRSISNLL
ncbi:hypothetical protein DYBT9623_01609 [Dyadobacter sp. CECT 9623]|uniref:Uncharacterized protein n=1 Tax=Dyadobacter linearis TaxID=2823330 RepID=A0ABN7RAL9_9BACT|nr:hypothetical protein DYBT9623_01609 [Dyadobacter sp. CECT 9623]